ncbi:extracellular solute-binding protein [Marinobacter sp. C2H3]|uniref:extracellular solute-binding protein n=1 Tax=Marinobacter sp. C2H3 TaxID=3119003 RepID=UPI00300F4465
MTRPRLALWFRVGLTALAGLMTLSASAAGAPASEANLTHQHGLSMYGDLKYPRGFDHFDYVNPEAPKGGTLRLSVVANGYDSFNPFDVKGVSAAGVGSYLYDTLLEASADEPFSEYGLIAESVEVPDDRSYVVFNLRPEARFQDGQPITAEDVKFTFDTLVTKGHPFYRNYYADVKDVVVENPHRVRFDFRGTTNRELPLIVGQLPVLPKHYWKDRDFGDNSLTPPVGSGPYRIADFEAGRSITFERVKDYWAKDLGVRKGRFNVDRIRYDYYSDDTVALEAFKAGNFDFRLEASAKNWATAYTGPMFENGSVVKEAIEQERPAGMQGFAYNTRRAVFSDPKVRRALAYAFDFEWANKNLFYGQYTRTDSYFENSDLASSGTPSDQELALLAPYRDQLPPALFSTPYEPPTTDGKDGLRGNLRTALELLRSAGYQIKDGKMVNQATGQPLAFEILLFQQSFERVVLPFKNTLARLGIDVNVRLVDTSQYIRRVRDFDFDMIVQTIPQSDSPGNEQREYWSSATANVTGSRNYMGVSSPVVDALVDKVIQAPDREALETRVHALDRVLLYGYYVIPQWHLTRDRVAYWRKLHRPEITPKNGIDLNDWWIEP